MAKPPTFAKMAPRYANMWARMEIDPKKLKIVDATAREIIEKRKTRYLKVEAATGVPWWWIAVAHHREASGSFAGVLHNGDRIIGTGRTTYRVPKGRGPFATWEEAAIDALKMPGKELHKIKDWTLERAAYQLEAFNGWGYFWKGIPSSYLWSFSNIARPGKYVADHVWDSNAVDGQMGVMPLLQRLQALDASVVFGT
jgi:lysozyme family protein